MRRFAGISLALILATASTATLVESASATSPTMAAAKAGKKARKKVKKLLRRQGLAKLPSVSGVLAARTARRGRKMIAAAVTGTPPALVEIPGSSIKNLFWQPGLVDAITNGIATPEQCNQFWAGHQDGDSGGLGACHMAESVGYSLGNILQSETSLCYMKNFPTRANVDAGALTVLSGTLPGNDVSRLFSVPTGSVPRVVKVHVTNSPGGDGGGGGNESIFLRVASEGQNAASGHLYEVDLWFCPEGELQPRGRHEIDVLTSGEFSSLEEDDHGDGIFVSQVTGHLTFAGGQVSFDSTRPRRGRVEATHGGGAFKGDVSINPDNTITTKSYDSFGGGARKVYLVTSFSGTGPESVRFLTGAFKERHSQDGIAFGDGFSGSTEYRDSYYAASPGSALEAELGAVDLDSDPFYASAPSASVDTSAYSCDTTADVEVAIDFSNPAARALSGLCENAAFREMHFCHDDPEVRVAEDAYFRTCSHNQGP